MQIEINIDEKCKEPKIIVMTDKMTDEVNAIIKRLSDEQPQVIAGFREDVVEVLEPAEIYRVFAESGKVFAETNHGEYALRLRLYEAEQRLDSKTFVRISNSDIINLRKVKSFDLSFVGTILHHAFKRYGYLCFTAIRRQNQTTVRNVRWQK